MAATEGGAESDERVPPEFECSICMKLLLEPVTVSCGHTFCRACLEQSLGYRSLCAVCRAPVAAGQGVNILVKSIIADRYPIAMAQRQRELEEDLQAGEREADEARHREVRGGGTATATEGTAPVLPLVLLGQGFGLKRMVLPHCRAELEVRLDVEERLLAYALQGGRRLGVVDATGPYDDNARPFGVCLEIEHVERNPQQRPRVHLVGKYRFWVVEEPQLHEDGFELGRCEAFFDAPLPTTDLVTSAANDVAQTDAENDANQLERSIATPELARSALDLLEQQINNIGQGGRRVVVERFGETPSIHGGGATGATTSATMERLSFWLLGSLLVDNAERRLWIGSVDTRERLEHCRSRLEAAGSRPVLDLPGARSWMNPGQSSLSSIVLLLAIVALFIAKAMGLFDESRRGGPGSRPMEDAWVFGQLLR